MKAKTRQALFPALLFGGFLLTPGCSTPTMTVGAPARSDRAVLHVHSTVPTEVRCEWQHAGARVEHLNTTPFRLVLPARAVDEIDLSRPVEAGDVVVQIRSPGSARRRFVMDRSASGMRLERHDQRWEGRIF